MIAPTSFFADYGCHVRIYEEARALQTLGHEVTICTYHNGSDLPGFNIRRTLDVPWRKRVVVGSSRHKLYLDGVLTLETLRTGLATRPDLIHAHLHEGALIGGALSRLVRRPLVFDYQGSLTEEMLDHGFLRRNGRVQATMRCVERAIDRLPRCIITSSENARERLVGQGYAPERLTTILDAVDTERFSPQSVPLAERAELRRLFGIPEDARVVVYLGLLAPYQGSDLLLAAARRVVDQVPNAFFLIMGFPGNERYRVIAEQIGLAERTSFPGRVSYIDAHRYLALGDVAVAPKMSLTEGNGKLYNYMAMGLPVVAFEAAANREILGDLGSYAPLGEVAGFAAQTIRLLTNPEEASALGAQLRKRVLARHAWRDRVHELTAVYRDILSGRAYPSQLAPDGASRLTSLPTTGDRSAAPPLDLGDHCLSDAVALSEEIPGVAEALSTAPADLHRD